MHSVANAPSTLPQANDPCWCGSGRKYKRCHKRSEGRVLPGVVSPMRPVPAHIGRPPYADTGVPLSWDEPRVKSPEVIERMRTAGAVAAEILRLAGEAVRPGPDHRRARRLRPRPLHRARRLPVTAQLQRLPQEPVHLGERGHLPRHPRLTGAGRRRHRQPRRHRLHRRGARRHQRHVPRRRRRPGEPPAGQGHRGVHVVRHRGGQAGPPDQRHRPGHRGPRQGPPLRRHPGLHRPRHRRAVPLRHPGAPLLRLAGVDDHAARA